MNLSAFEVEVLELSLKTELPELLFQLPFLFVVSRKNTPMGIVVELDIEAINVRPRLECKSIARTMYGFQEGRDEILRFDISIEDGVVKTIEIFNNDATQLPKDYEKFCLGFLEKG